MRPTAHRAGRCARTVKLVEGIITASPEFFEGKSEEECRRFFEDAYEFVKAEMGAENMIHFTVHMDETTPHAHWGAGSHQGRSALVEGVL